MYEKLSWRARGRLWFRLGVRLALAGLGIGFTWKLLPPLLSLLAPFLAAWLLSALLNPALRRLQRRLGWSRRLLALLLILLLCVLAGGGVSLLVYYAGAELLSLAQNWEELLAYAQSAEAQLEALFDRLPELVPRQLSQWVRSGGERLLSWLWENLSALAGRAAAWLGGLAMKTPAFLLALIVFIMACYLLSADYPYLRMRAMGHMGEGTLDLLRRVRQAAGSAFGGYLRAELLLSAGVFVILLAGFLFMGQSYALLLALGLAVLDFIPILGSGTVLVPWAAVSLLTGRYASAASLMAVWGVVVVFRRVAEPKFVGDQTGLSPVLSLVSIYVGMKLAGVPGMILGPVFTLVALNLAGLGMFRGTRADLSAAAEDLAAILRERE